MVLVFSRVRRSDVVLAVVAGVALLGGTVLTIASKLGISGPILIGVGILTAAAAGVRPLWNLFSGLRSQQTKEHDRLEAILRVPIVPVEDVDPFQIGVFRSVLAERESSDQTAPPYIRRRRVDDSLKRAFAESSLRQTRRLVVLRGDPKAGKTRTLWEAVKKLEGRKLLALAPPAQVGEDEPAYAPLSTLLGLERPVSDGKGRDLVVWIDDAQNHLQRGLTRDNLRRLEERYPEVAVAMTIHGYVLDGIQDVPLHALLRQPFDDLLLTATQPVERSG